MDTLRLAVTPSTGDPPEQDGFQVEIWVNDVEMTRAGAGLGMDPYDVLVPENRFVAEEAPKTIPVARCECGVYGCGSTDATITRTPDGIRWDWQIEVPMDGPVVFDRQDYEREVKRVSSDHSWETPARTAGRLVLTGIDNEELPVGLRLDWAANKWRQPELFEVCLRHENRHQIFVTFNWEARSPEELASEVRQLLVDTRPEKWLASWSSIQQSDEPPPMASDDWTRKRF